MELSYDELQVEAGRHLALSEDVLFMALVSDDDAAAFSEGGRLARGREIFRSIWDDIGHTVCAYYKANGKTFGDQVNAIAMVAAPLLGNPSLHGISVVAFAALVVKTGVDKLCDSRPA